MSRRRVSFARLVCYFIVIALTQPNTAQSYLTGDLYAILGLERGASPADIKRAYRSLSLIYHPDKQRNVDDDEKRKASERFVEIQKAYSTLSDPEAKRTYDLQSFSDATTLNRDSHLTGFNRRGTWDTGSAADGHVQRGGFQQAEMIASETVMLNEKNFDKLVFNRQKPWLVQIYDDTIDSCHRAGPTWEMSARLLNGVAEFGRIHALTSPVLVQRLGSSALFSRPIRRSDLPVIIGIRPNCKHPSCVIRYRGSIKADLLVSYVSEKVLRLPHLPLLPNDQVLSMTADDKVQFVLVTTSTTSVIARYLAMEHKSDVQVVQADFDKDKTFWLKNFGISKAPAMLIIRDFGATVAEDVSSKEKMKEVFTAHRFHRIPKLTASSAAANGCSPDGPQRICFVGIHSRSGVLKQRLKRTLWDTRNEVVARIPSMAGEVSFGWIEGVHNKKFLERFGGGDGEVSLVALIFNEIKPTTVHYDAFAKPDYDKDTIVPWVLRILNANRDDFQEYNMLPSSSLFDETGAHVPSDEIIKALRTDVSDLIEALWYFTLETGALPLLGTIFAIITASWLRRLMTRIQMNNMNHGSQQRQNMKKKVEHQLVDIQGHYLKGKTIYVVTIVTPEPNERFRKLAERFKSEKLLAFVELCQRDVDAFGYSQVFNDPRVKSHVIIWHPSKSKWQSIGDVDDSTQIEQKLDQILNGRAQWIEITNTNSKL